MNVAQQIYEEWKDLSDEELMAHVQKVTKITRDHWEEIDKNP